MELIQQIDTAILLFIQNHMRIETWNGFWRFITSLADKGWFWIAVSILLLVPKKTRMAGIASLVSLELCWAVFGCMGGERMRSFIHFADRGQNAEKWEKKER